MQVDDTGGRGVLRRDGPEPLSNQTVTGRGPEPSRRRRRPPPPAGRERTLQSRTEVPSTCRSRRLPPDGVRRPRLQVAVQPRPTPSRAPRLHWGRPRRRRPGRPQASTFWAAPGAFRPEDHPGPLTDLSFVGMYRRPDIGTGPHRSITAGTRFHAPISVISKQRPEASMFSRLLLAAAAVAHTG
jgi:hypothetical protein